MIRITFEKDTGRGAVCTAAGRGCSFVMNREPFEHRECRFYGDALLFDGYSVWFEGEGEDFKPEGDFTLSMIAAPVGYSDRGDGLFSLFDLEKREGLYVRIWERGRIEVVFGNGKTLFELSSINAHAVKNAWNHITVIFRQEAGWCDLYVNGILSNRRQFPRHMQLKWPKGKAYLGRYVDHADYGENAVSGIYYGLMEEMLVCGEALTAEQVGQLRSSYSVGEKIERIVPDRRVYAHDVQRPRYHLIAPGKWMNEPHGPFYYEGYYHIFYQANPHGPIWDHIQWGHLVSTDMVHWEDMPPALETGDSALDPDGCWSGSALVDKEGIPRIFYTAGNNQCFPNQFVAMATAVVDEGRRLPEWRKSEAPVVRQQEGWLGEFRDPFVWLEGDSYFMLVGSGDANNGGGNAVLYSSEDMQSWKSHGFLLDYDYEKYSELGHVFELPVLLPLRDEGGEVACHIFLMCACQIEGAEVENYAFLGKWEPQERRFHRLHDEPMLLDLGGGVFTGPSGFVTPDGRTVVFTIAQGMRDGRDAFYSGWAHNGGLPVELSIREKKLHIQPIRELAALGKRRLLSMQDVTLEEANRALADFRGNSFRMKVCADAQELAIETAGGTCKRIISYDRGSGRFGVADEDGRQLGKYRGGADRIELGEEPVCMEYYLDHSMIEVYLNGRKSITQRNYIQGEERSIQLGGEAVRIRELALWEMASAYGL